MIESCFIKDLVSRYSWWFTSCLVVTRGPERQGYFAWTNRHSDLTVMRHIRSIVWVKVSFKAFTLILVCLVFRLHWSLDIKWFQFGKIYLSFEKITFVFVSELNFRHMAIFNNFKFFCIKNTCIHYWINFFSKKIIFTPDKSLIL